MFWHYAYLNNTTLILEEKSNIVKIVWPVLLCTHKQVWSTCVLDFQWKLCILLNCKTSVSVLPKLMSRHMQCYCPTLPTGTCSVTVYTQVFVCTHMCLFGRFWRMRMTVGSWFHWTIEGLTPLHLPSCNGLWGHHTLIQPSCVLYSSMPPLLPRVPMTKSGIEM